MSGTIPGRQPRCGASHKGALWLGLLLYMDGSLTYDMEIKALEAALYMIHNIIINDNSPPLKIIISTNNTGAIQQIFQGSPGLDQTSLLTFCKNILDLLDQYKNICFTFTWCPGHF